MIRRKGKVLSRLAHRSRRKMVPAGRKIVEVASLQRIQTSARPPQIRTLVFIREIAAWLARAIASDGAAAKVPELAL